LTKLQTVKGWELFLDTVYSVKALKGTHHAHSTTRQDQKQNTEYNTKLNTKLHFSQIATIFSRLLCYQIIHSGENKDFQQHRALYKVSVLTAQRSVMLLMLLQCSSAADSHHMPRM